MPGKRNKKYCSQTNHLRKTQKKFMFFLQVFRIRHLKSHTIYPDRFSLLYFSHKEFPDKKAAAPLETTATKNGNNY